MLRWFMYNPRSTNQSRLPQPRDMTAEEAEKMFATSKTQLCQLFFFSGLRHFSLLIAVRLLSIHYFKQSDTRNQIKKKSAAIS